MLITAISPYSELNRLPQPGFAAKHSGQSTPQQPYGRRYYIAKLTTYLEYPPWSIHDAQER